MKVLLLNSIGLRKWGGGEKWMILAALGLIRRGHDVYIGCRKGSVLNNEAQKAGIATIVVSIDSDVSLMGAFQLIRICRKSPFDVIIGSQNRDVRTAGMARRFIGNPIIISRQGVKLIKNTWKQRLTYTNFCDGIITNTESIKNEYDAYGWWDQSYVKVIHNGVELSTPEGLGVDLKSYIPQSVNNPFIVLSAGRLTHQKGFEYLIEAANEICKKRQDVFFFIAGDGKLAPKLENQINSLGLSNHVFLIGFHQHLRQLLNQSHLFVLSSLYEGMPNVVMEAMINKVPVVSTQVNGVMELIRPNVDGVIVPPADGISLADGILSVVEASNRGEMIAHAYERICNDFSIEGMVGQLESYLTTKLASRHPKSCLIIQTAFIGDVILATSVIESLKKQLPNCDIDFLLRRGNEGLLDHHPHIRECLVFDKSRGKYHNLFRIIKKVRTKKYDLVVNIQRYATTGIITALSGAKTTVGFTKNPLSIFFSYRIKHQMNNSDIILHEIDRNHQLLNYLRLNTCEKPKLYPSTTDFEEVKCDEPYFCLAPTSVWFTKQYPLINWVKLINHLPHTQTIFLMGAKSDLAVCESIKNQATHPNIINKAGKLSFLKSAALMAGARMNFVNDSAPLHLASAMNAPVRALFCSTVPAFGYTPLSQNSLVIETDHVLSCRPCGLHGKKVCPQGHFKCGDISVEKILRLSNLNELSHV